MALMLAYIFSIIIKKSKFSIIITDHPESCWDADGKKAYKIGEEFSPGGCQKAICNPDFSFTYKE